MEVAIICMLHVHVHDLQKGFLAWHCYYVDIEKTEKGSLSGRFWRPLSSLWLACSIDSVLFRSWKCIRQQQRLGVEPISFAELSSFSNKHPTVPLYLSCVHRLLWFVGCLLASLSLWWVALGAHGVRVNAGRYSNTLFTVYRRGCVRPACRREAVCFCVSCSFSRY